MYVFDMIGGFATMAILMKKMAKISLFFKMSDFDAATSKYPNPLTAIYPDGISDGPNHSKSNIDRDV